MYFLSTRVYKSWCFYILLQLTSHSVVYECWQWIMPYTFLTLQSRITFFCYIFKARAVILCISFVRPSLPGLLINKITLTLIRTIHLVSVYKTMSGDSRSRGTMPFSKRAFSSYSVSRTVSANISKKNVRQDVRADLAEATRAKPHTLPFI